MAPKKSNKTSKSKNSDKKKPDQDETRVNTTIYEITDLPTIIKLLSSQQEDVKLKAFFAIAQKCDNDKLFTNKVVQFNVLPLVITYIYSTEIVVLRQCLKLIINLLQFEKPFGSIHVNEWKHYEEQLICLYTKGTDVISREYAAYVINIITKRNANLAEVFLQNELMSQLFETMRTIGDPDIIYLTLCIILNAVQLPAAPQQIATNPRFDIRFLICCIEFGLPEIAHMSADIILQLCAFHHRATEERIILAETVKKILPLIMDFERMDLHECLFKIFLELLQSKENVVAFITSREFLQFCQFAPVSHVNDILRVSEVFITITRWSTLIQNLYDFSVEDSVVSLLRYKNVDVICNVALILSKFLQNRFCCEKLCKPVILEIFLDLLKNPTVDVIPHKNIILKVLHEFFKKNSNAVKTVVELNGIALFVNLFLSDVVNMKDNHKVYIFDIIYVLCSYPNYKFDVINPTVYAALIELLEFKTEEVLYILNQFVQYDEYRAMFMDQNGPSLIIKALEKTRSEKLFKELLIFVRNIIIYENFVIPFLKLNLMQTLKKMQKVSTRNIPMLGRVIDTLYDLYLPFKFHETKRLDIKDVIKDKFYLIRENVNLPFPFLEVLEHENPASNYTVYLIDSEDNYKFRFLERFNNKTFNNAESLTSIPSYLYTGDTESGTSTNFGAYNNNFVCSMVCLDSIFNSIGLRSILKKSDETTRNIGTCTNPETKRVSFVEGEGSDSCPGIYVQEPLYNDNVVTDKIEVTDPIKEVQKELTHQLCSCITNRFRVIAEYVHSAFTLSSEIEFDQNYFYNMQLQLLKKTLETNIIPIQLVQCGSYCERALLFKYLCDTVGLPTTLVKGKNLMFYNEIPLVCNAIPNECKDHNIQYYVIDLLYQIGNLMPVGSDEATRYINKQKGDTA